MSELFEKGHLTNADHAKEQKGLPQLSCRVDVSGKVKIKPIASSLSNE